MGAYIFLEIVTWLLLWGLEEYAILSVIGTEIANKDDPYYIIYVNTIRYLCKNLTLFGKIVVITLVSIILLPGVIIVPVMRFIMDVLKAAIFK